jgi:copper chaperone CopZ
MATTSTRALREENATQAEGAAASHAVLDLEGMTCASCAVRIEKGLKQLPGVKEANVNLASERATVTYDPTLTDLEQMVRKVEAIGYKATPLAAPQKPVEVSTTSSTPGAFVVPMSSLYQ